MLPIVLVLLVATSALAAPGVNLNFRSANEVVPPKHNGRPVSAFYTDQALGIVDNGNINTYVLYSLPIINDLANNGHRSSQALALAQTIGVLGSVVNGIPGDACAAATVIDAYVHGTSTDNRAIVRSAVSKFIHSLSSTIDQIVQVSVNTNALRSSTGPRGNCNGNGRSYQFEAAWDYILSNAHSGTADLVNEQYCAAKRLYNSPDLRSNIAGAFITAASLPAVNNVFQEALEPVAKFVAALPSGNAAGAAAAAKKALARAAN